MLAQKPPHRILASSTVSQIPRSPLIMNSGRSFRDDWEPAGMTQQQLQERGISSLEDYIATRDARRKKRDELQAFMARTDVTGQEKGWARCEYILNRGRLPYQCKQCWLLPGNCICGRLRRFKPQTKVVIHLHPDEWGRGSNTGSLCSTLQGCELLLRGHKQHDERLQELLHDPHSTCAVLWPGPEALEPDQLQQLAAERSNGRVTLVAIDATWDCARKMKGSYPKGVHMLKLPAHLALPANVQAAQAKGAAAAAAAPQSSSQDAAAATYQSTTNASSSSSSSSDINAAEQTASMSSTLAATSKRTTGPNGQPVSLFRPLRKYKGNAAENGRVSTIEAVAAALLALEGDQEMYEGLLHNLQQKVDAMLEQCHKTFLYANEAEPV